MFVSNSDSEVPEVGEDDLELQGSFCTSDEATDEHYLHEAYADEPLAGFVVRCSLIPFFLISNNVNQLNTFRGFCIQGL